MNCRELTTRVVPYLDGDLDDVTASACRGHLRSCHACRDLAADHARVRDGLAELERPDAPADLWQQINTRLGAAEIADNDRSSLARGWSRLLARIRPMVVPVALTASACAVAVVVVQARRSQRAEVPLALTIPHDSVGDDRPTLPADAPPPNRTIVRDVIDERGDRAREVDDRFRGAAAELLTLARAEVAAWPTARAHRFDVAVQRREKTVLAAAPGRERERAWHELTAYLQAIALHTSPLEQVASIEGGR